MVQQQCHFLGIGGIGMSALAHIVLDQNWCVSGSDRQSNPRIEQLIARGAVIEIGAEDNVPVDSIVVYSSDIKANHSGLQAAYQQKCQVLHRAAFLAQQTQNQRLLAVAGSHGKTTTSALLTTVLLHSGQDPSYAIGGMLVEQNKNGAKNKGAFFVAEADESDGSFLQLQPEGGIVTNITQEHLTHYGNFAAIKRAFADFSRSMRNPQLFFWCGDDLELWQLQPPGISYGRQDHCAVHIRNCRPGPWKVIFDLFWQGTLYADIELALLGEHNILNAAAVFALSKAIGIDEKSIRTAFRSFQGVERRCQQRLHTNQLLIIDDYAHHPNEIKATLKGIRNAIEERRLIVLFQPHRYTRFNDFGVEFATAFTAADQVWVTDVYAAGESSALQQMSPQQLLKQMSLPASRQYVPRQQLIAELLPCLRPYDVVVTLGAGDITAISQQLAQQLQHRLLPALRVGVLCGGASPEHSISLLSTRQIVEALEQLQLPYHIFGITPQSQWLQGSKEVIEQLAQKEYSAAKSLAGNTLDTLMQCDVIIPVLHGANGEDGTLQGFLQTLHKPYVGCNWRAAALAMDKALTKRIAISYGYAVAPFVDFTIGQWQQQPTKCLQRIAQLDGFPLYVKAVHLGSSIGVYKVTDQAALLTAIENVLQLDDKVLVESNVVGREIEFAVLGNQFIKVPPAGEIVSQGQTYDYDRKYNTQTMDIHTQASISVEIMKQGQLFAENIYRALDCSGLARVDCFLTPQGEFILNEVNPFPGFTAHSLYAKIWQQQGLSMAQLVEKLLQLALHRHVP